MRSSRLLPGVVLCLLMIPRVLHAQDAPRIILNEDITDARGDKVDKTKAPFIIHITGSVVNAMNSYVYLVVHEGEAARIQSTAGLGYIVSNRFDFFGHCTLGRPNDPGDIDKRYGVFAVVTDKEYERDQQLDETTVIATSHVITLFRSAAPPHPVPPPQPAPLPQGVPPPHAVITARITSPQQGAKVAQKISVEGVIAGLRPHEHVFLCLQSQAFGRLIYPQGKVLPDVTGQWTVESIYATPGYRYATFLVITTNTASAAMLNDQHARKYGMHALPPSTERLGTAIVVTRE